MPHAVYTGIIDLGDVDLEDLEATQEAINEALYDVLDDGGDLTYKVICSLVIDADKHDKMMRERGLQEFTDPSQNSLGGFRGSDPDTSRKAAINNYPRSGSQRNKALIAIRRAGDNGLTGQEVSEVTGIDYRSVTPRLAELKRGDWIVDSGRTRKTNLDAEAIILIATERGQRYVDHYEGEE